jgi:hypothetical protein
MDVLGPQASKARAAGHSISHQDINDSEGFSPVNQDAFE